MRALIADDEDDQSIHPQVFRALRQLLSARIEVGRPSSYIDATNLFEAQRRPFIELAAGRGCAVDALCFETPLEVCLERNRNRSRRVPEQVIRELAESFERPRLAEGFRRIEVVRDA
jgi:predicted kinase